MIRFEEKLVKSRKGSNDNLGELTTSGLLNEKLFTQHISGPVTKYKLKYVSNQGRIGARVRALDIVIC